MTLNSRIIYFQFRGSAMFVIQAPSHCPGCASVLEWSNHLLFCRNPDCDSQVEKRIEHFAKTLKIKGLGPAAIAKLELSSIHDIYTISEDQIAECLSSSKLAEKLFAEITNSKNAPLNMVLPAFSIPLIGKTATEKLSTVCDSIFSIDEDKCRLAGLGPKATENLLAWYAMEFIGGLENLPLCFVYSKNKSKPEKCGVVCISGKLKSFKTKADAKQALEAKGFTIKDSVTKEVTILVNESGVESAKTKQARDSGVTIVTNLFEFIGDF